MIHGRLLSSLLVEHSQNSIYGYSKSLSSNVYGSPNWETYKAHGGKSVYKLSGSDESEYLVPKIDFGNIVPTCESVARKISLVLDCLFPRDDNELVKLFVKY